WVVSVAVRWSASAKKSPPVGLNALAGSCGRGAFAYAALAPAVAWLIAVGSNPMICRFQRSVVGLLYSQRRPRLTVRFGRTCQSSWRNSTSYRASFFDVALIV